MENEIICCLNDMQMLAQKNTKQFTDIVVPRSKEKPEYAYTL